MEVWYVDPGSTAGSPDGTTGHPYLSLQAALVAKCNKTFTEAIQIRCRTTGDLPADTTRVSTGVLGQYDEDGYGLQIVAETGHRASTFWDDTKYRLYPAYAVQAGTALGIATSHVIVDGLQIGISTQTAAAEIVYWGYGQTGVLSNCLVKGLNSADYLTRGISLIQGLTIFNCLFYAIGANVGSAVVKNHGNSKFYNCTFIAASGMLLGLDITDGTCVAKNTYVGGATNCFWQEGTLTCDHCASSDGTADDFTGAGVVNVPVSTATFKSVTTDDEDYAIPDGDSDLYHAGTDTSGDTAPLNFTTDINEYPYYSSRSIGCDEFDELVAPTVTASAPTAVTATTATGHGNVTSDGYSTITERGICIGASADPTTAGTHFSTSGTTGAFDVAITGLTAGATYHYRTYAINDIGTAYSADGTFAADSAVAAGTAFSTGHTNTTADLSCDAATHGTPGYTYQWYRSGSTGFTPGAGNILSGKTSLTLADTGLEASTDYYYKLVATDAAAATSTSNEVHVVTDATPPKLVLVLK